MAKMSLCLACGGDQDEKMHLDLRERFKTHKLSEEWMNPGGRLLVFKQGQIQLGDCCKACDHVTLDDFFTGLEKENLNG